MKKTIVCLGCMTLLAATGCSARYAILTAPAVSMTDPSFDPAFKGTPAGKVEAQHCPGDQTVSSHDNNVGLIDEAVLKAQQKSNAKYLSDVTISRDGNCIVVEATVMK